MTKVAEDPIQISLPAVGDDEWHAVRESIESGWLTQGPKVAAFEESFATRHQSRFAVATTSCTTGLHLVLTALGIGAGDEVIIPAFTWIATANVVLYCGAKPVFVDVDPNTFNIDPAQIRSKLSDRTKAVIAVHLFGLPADIDEIQAVLPDNVPIIEDAACAAGAVCKGRSVGALGRAAVFSFHPRKSITTGEGGMITTDDKELVERLIALRNHGASVPEEVRHRGNRPHILPEFGILGFNYRMTDLQAAIGIVQLSKLDAFVEERKKWASYYQEQLQDVGWLSLPEEPKNDKHAWQAFVTRVDPNKAPYSRNRIMDILHESGIATRPGTHSVPTLQIYRDRFGFSASDFPVAESCSLNSMAIPLHNRMDDADYSRVVNALKAL